MPHDSTPAPTTRQATPTPLSTPGQPAGSLETDGARPARRSVVALGAAAALGVGGAAVLTACGSDSSGGASAQGTSGGGGAAGGTSSAAPSAPSGPLAKLSTVPVGSGVLASGPDGKAIVITQAKAGQVAAVSALCTHQGCKVLVEGAKLNCPCHGSQFDLTGKVLTGPATQDLPPVAVKVSGTDVVAG